MLELATDPVVDQLRGSISDNDRKILEAVNNRLKLVERMKRYKETRGLEFHDPEREEWIVRDLMRANRGPLSADGVRELFDAILALSKRELFSDARPA
jgi:chorismate mutase